MNSAPGSGRDSGHVLIVIVIMLLLMVLATLLVFDLQTTTRGKVKLQAAADAAALTGAEWQRKSLNLIGELNMVKATATLLDLPDESAAITEMQTQIAFTGPLIGVGAAQQAAKNNGVDANSDVAAIYLQQIERLHSDVYDDADQEINGYSWRAPYARMLYQIYSEQPATMVSNTTGALDDISPGWLGDEALFWAIIDNNYCYWRLRRLLDNDPDDYWNSGWWKNISAGRIQFSGQSEYLPLRIEFSDTQLNRQENWSEVESLAATLGIPVNGQLQLHFAVYDDSWNDLPASAWNRTDGRLQSELSAAANCGGAIAGVQVEQTFPLRYRYQPSLGTTSAWRKNPDPNRAMDSTESLRYGAALIKSKFLTARKYDDYGQGVGVPAKALAAAKALWGGKTDLMPAAGNVVLPGFNQVALVPSSMYPQNNLSSGRSFVFERFLFWLRDHGSEIADITVIPADLPTEFLPYMFALKKLCNNAALYDYSTPALHADGSPILNAFGLPTYTSEKLSFRDRGRRWLQEHGAECPQNGSEQSWGPMM